MRGTTNRCLRGLCSFLLTLLFSAVLIHADTLQLPAGLTLISEQAFYGNQSLDEVVLPEGLQRIESQAFANTSITRVEFPDSLTWIAPDAFDGSPDVVGWGNAGTYAARYCASHGIPYLTGDGEMAIIGPAVFDYRPAYAEGYLMDTQVPLTLVNAPAGVPVNWQSSDPSLASVDSAGYVHLHGKGGTVTISASAGSLYAEHVLTINTEKIFPISYSSSSQILADGSWQARVGESIEVMVLQPASGETVEWTSSDENVVSIRSWIGSYSYATLYFYGEGTAVVTASFGDSSISQTIHVSKAPEDTVFIPAFYYGTALTQLLGEMNTLYLDTYGMTSQLIAQKEEDIVWTSGDESILRVYGNGISACAVGLQEGTAEVTASCDGRSASVTVKVVRSQDANVPLQLQVPVQLEAGSYVDLNALGGTRTLGYTYVSSDESVASVEGGSYLYGVDTGTCTITVYNGDASSSATVEVVPATSSGEQALSVAAPSQTLLPGNTYTVRVYGYTQESDSSPVITSSDPAVVQAEDLRSDEYGYTYLSFRCRRAGTAALTLTAGGETASVDVTVADVSTVNLRYSGVNSEDLGVGSERPMVVLGTDDAASVTWSSSNPEVASVDAEGKVKGLSVGKTTITATAGGHSDSVVIHVRDWNSQAGDSYLQIDTSKSVLTPGNTGYIYHSGGTDEPISYTSSDPEVVSVREYGDFTALKPGTAVITAVCGSLSDSVTITVLDEAELPLTIWLNRGYYDAAMPESLSLYEGTESGRLTLGSSASGNPALVWTIADPDITEIRGGGIRKLFGKAIGSTILTVTDGARSATLPVTVLENTLPLSLSWSAYDSVGSLGIGKDVRVTVKNTVPGAELTVASSDPSVAAVEKTADDSFTIRAAKAGSADITVQSGSKTLTKTFRFSQGTPTIEIYGSQIWYEGDSISVSVKDGWNYSQISWSLEDNGTGAFLAEDGYSTYRRTLTAGRAGTVTLTVTCDGVSASRELRILPAAEAPVDILLYRYGADGEASVLNGGYVEISNRYPNAMVKIRNLPEGASVSWNSTDEDTLRVDGSGKLTVLGDGSALLRADITYADGSRETLQTSVYASYEEFGFEIYDAEDPAAGQFLHFGIRGRDREDVTLELSDPSMAMLDPEDEYRFYLLKEGELTITAICGEERISRTVQVEEGRTMYISGGMLADHDQVSMREGDSAGFYVYEYENDITCTSDDEAVLSVTDCYGNYASLQANAAGTAHITISDGYTTLERTIQVTGGDEASCPVYMETEDFFTDAYTLYTYCGYNLYIPDMGEEGSIDISTDADILKESSDWGAEYWNDKTARKIYIGTAGATGDVRLTITFTPEDTSKPVKTAAVLLHVVDEQLEIWPDDSWQYLYAGSIYDLYSRGVNPGTVLSITVNDPAVAEVRETADGSYKLHTLRAGEIIITAQTTNPDGTVSEIFTRTVNVRSSEETHPYLRGRSSGYYTGAHVRLHPMRLPEGVSVTGWQVSDPSLATVADGEVVLLRESYDGVTVTALLSNGETLEWSCSYIDYREFTFAVQPASDAYRVGSFLYLIWDGRYWDDMTISFSDPSMVAPVEGTPSQYYLLKEGELTVTAAWYHEQREETIVVGEGRTMYFSDEYLADHEQASVYAGDDIWIYVDNNAASITCSSDNEAVLSVEECDSDYARLRANAAGTAHITITDGYTTLERTIQVTEETDTVCAVYTDDAGSFCVDEVTLYTNTGNWLYVRNMEEEGTVAITEDNALLNDAYEQGIAYRENIDSPLREIYVSTAEETGDVQLTITFTPKDPAGMVKTASVLLHIVDQPLEIQADSDWDSLFAGSIYSLYPQGVNPGTTLSITVSDPDVAEVVERTAGEYELHTFRAGTITMTAQTKNPDGTVSENYSRTVRIHSSDDQEPSLSGYYRYGMYVGWHVYMRPMQLPEGVTVTGWEVSDPSLARVTDGDVLLLAETEDGVTVTATLSNGDTIEWNSGCIEFRDSFLRDATPSLVRTDAYAGEAVPSDAGGELRLTGIPWQPQDLEVSLSEDGIIRMEDAGQSMNWNGYADLPFTAVSPGTVTVTVTTPTGETYTEDVTVTENV